MITLLAEKIFSNIKYGTNHSIERANFAISEFANTIQVDNKPCGCSRFTTCNHPSLEKVNKLKNGL